MERGAIAAFTEQWEHERPDLDVTPMLVIGRVFRLTDALDRQLRPPFGAAGLVRRAVAESDSRAVSSRSPPRASS